MDDLPMHYRNTTPITLSGIAASLVARKDTKAPKASLWVLCPKDADVLAASPHHTSIATGSLQEAVMELLKHRNSIQQAAQGLE